MTPATRMFLPSRMPTDVPSAVGGGLCGRSSVAHAEAAVDWNDRPGDVTGSVTGEKLDRPGNVVYRAEPSQRICSAYFLTRSSRVRRSCRFR